ncbi:hypothetical protein DTL42_15940 [Bremerella cremea]|uniref:Glycosyltransferase RgtA/B/C/D-like domain-containing protein n=1 Tax=Bremerella cremea TaxID=1031537 RepID=A0A368KPG0_9BACT|nr:hypothetical protein [Bremerella cremea]RCS46447.1 hypothetical protein DTL42_15940 [Bremerella cremea]
MNPKLHFPTWLQSNWGHIPGLILLGCVVALLIHIFFLPAFAADEIAFFIWGDAMKDNPPSLHAWDFLFRYNRAGYGASYWTVYINLIEHFGVYGIWAMRVLACAAFIGISLAIAVVGNMAQRYLGYLLMALWLSMPAAWWFGKVTGPESFALAFAVFGVLLLYVVSHNERLPWRVKPIVAESLAWLLIGGAISLKATNLPSAMFAFLIVFAMPKIWEEHSKSVVLKKMLFAIGLMACGLVICSPNAILNPSQFLFHLTELPRTNAWKWEIAKMSLSNQLWGWDGIFAGGLLQWGLCPLAMCVLGLALLIKSPRVFAILLATFLACWGMICSSGFLLGWYWFGWISMIALAILWAIRENSSNRVITSAIVVTILINIFYQAPAVISRYQLKAEQSLALAQLDEVQHAIDDNTQDRQYDLVLDYWEVSHIGGLYFKASPGKEIFQMTPRYFPAFAKDKADPNDARTNKGQAVEAETMTKIIRLGEEGTQGKSVLLVLSKRLASKHAFGDMPTFSRDRIIPQSPPGTTCTELLDLPYTLVYELRTTREKSSEIGDSTIQKASLEIPLE